MWQYLTSLCPFWHGSVPFGPTALYDVVSFTTDNPLAVLLEEVAGTECKGVTGGSYFITGQTFSYTHFISLIFIVLFCLFFVLLFLLW